MEKDEKICSGLKCKACGYIKDMKMHVLKVIRGEEYCDHQICQNCDYAEKKNKHDLKKVKLDETYC